MEMKNLTPGEAEEGFIDPAAADAEVSFNGCRDLFRGEVGYDPPLASNDQQLMAVKVDLGFSVHPGEEERSETVFTEGGTPAVNHGVGVQPFEFPDPDRPVRSTRSEIPPVV